MKISSVFNEGEKIPIEYTADGEDINPELVISEILEKTKSLVLIVDDPDAQKVVGYTWLHWVIFDIPVEGSEVIIKKDSIPGTPGQSTYKKAEYGGPNPPAGSGIHNYHFKIYALDKKLGLPKMSSFEDIMKSMKGHMLDNSNLVGQYSRK